MPFEITPELILGPLGGFVLTIYFCFRFLNRFEAMTKEMMDTFRLEIQHCESRYRQVLDELLRLKEG